MAKTANIPAPPAPPAVPAAKPSDDVTTAQTSTSPPTPPTPPAPPVAGPTGDTSTTAADTASTTSEPVKAGDPPTDDNAQAAAEQKAREPNAGGDSENGPVTTSAELHGGVLASDAQAKPDDDDLADVPVSGSARVDAIRAKAFRAGRAGRALRQRHKSLTDSEWAEYRTAHARGEAQGEADGLSVDDRLARVERALGLPVPNRE